MLTSVRRYATWLVLLLTSNRVLNGQGPRASAMDPRDTIMSFAVRGWGVALEDRDTAVRPGDDFIRYVSGRWVDRVNQAALDRNDSYWRDLMRLPPRRIAQTLKELAEDRTLSPETPEGKAAAFYRAFADSARIRRAGLSPLAPALDAIRAARTHSDLARVMGEEAGAWTPRPVSVTVQTFPTTLFTLQISQNPRDVTRTVVLIGAAGLLLPAPSYYSDPAQEDIRQAYVEYIAGMLRLVQWPHAAERAKDVLALETRLAAASWTLGQRRDAASQTNPMTLAELRSFAPELDWTAYLGGAGLSTTKDVVIDTRSAFPKLTKIFAETPIEVWQARQAFAILDQDAPKLDDAAAALALDFRARRFQGTAASQPCDMRIMLAADASIPDIIGALYAKKYFSPAVRAATEEMTRRIRDAFDLRLARSPYLSDASKQRARAKLAAMRLDIGAPAHATDYRGLVLSDTDYFGNLRRARAFEWKRQIASLAKPFDRDAWPLQPHNTNYAYIPNTNILDVSAGALEPPFFDLSADPAVNYGAVGTLIAAQMAAAFDGNGRHFGPDGSATEIFSPSENARLDAQRDSLSAQLSQREALPGLPLQGALLVDEDANDIIGIGVALDAYHRSLNDSPAPVRDGTTGDQRFFLGRAQMWRAMFVPNFIRVLVATGHNTPPPIRIAFTAQHSDAWYDAFGVTSDQRMYIPPEKRLHFLF
jgi:putative endopeptidase